MKQAFKRLFWFEQDFQYHKCIQIAALAAWTYGSFSLQVAILVVMTLAGEI